MLLSKIKVGSLFFLICFICYVQPASAFFEPCYNNTDCGAGTCNVTSNQCECPDDFIHTPKAGCIPKAKRANYTTAFHLEFWLGLLFPAGFAYEGFWPLAGIRLGVETLAGILITSTFYSRYKDRTQMPAINNSKISYSTRSKILATSAIFTSLAHIGSWIMSYLMWAELQWPDKNVKKFIHQTGNKTADLVIMGSKIVESAQITLENFTDKHCAVIEGCVDGIGERRLLRFDSYLLNIGDGDFVVAFEDIRPEWSGCHGHFHAPEATDYILKQELMQGNQTITVRYGHKQGYCFRDTVNIFDKHGGKYGCGIPKLTVQLTQGITAGWADIYEKDLDCQWIDITDVLPGTYQLIITVNPYGAYYQDNLENNISIVEVKIPPVNETVERTQSGQRISAQVLKEYDSL